MSFFDSNDVEDSEFQPLPRGDYTLTVVDSQVKPTKAATGTYMQVEFSVEGSGKKLFDRFNITNPNPTAVKIGKSQLKQLCVVAGKPVLQDPHDLVGSRVKGTVSHKMYEGKVFEEIVKYQPAPVQTMTAPQQQTSQFNDLSAIPF